MTFKTALIISSRQEFKNIFRNTLKDRGFSQIDVMSSSDDFEKYIKLNHSFFTAIDFALGEKQVVFLLEVIQENTQAEVATVLNADFLSGKAIAIACEFGVDYLSSLGLVQSEVKNAVIGGIEVNQRSAPIRKIIKKSGELKKSGEFQAMHQLLLAASVKLPHSNEIAIGLAGTEIELGKWEEAKSRLLVLSKVQPPLLRAQHLLARCLMHDGDFAGAEKMLRHTKLLNPYNPDRLSDLGHAIFVQGQRLIEASELFDDALEMDPDHKGAHIGKSGCLLTQGDIKGAMALIKDVASNRELASIFNISAVLNIRKQKFQSGIDLYNYAINAVQGDQDALARLYFNAGLGLKRWKKFDEAQRFFLLSKDADPNFGKAHRHLQGAPQTLGKRLEDGSLAAQPKMGDLQSFRDFDDLGEASLGFSGFDNIDLESEE